MWQQFFFSTKNKISWTSSCTLRALFHYQKLPWFDDFEFKLAMTGGDQMYRHCQTSRAQFSYKHTGASLPFPCLYHKGIHAMVQKCLILLKILQPVLCSRYSLSYTWCDTGLWSDTEYLCMSNRIKHIKAFITGFSKVFCHSSPTKRHCRLIWIIIIISNLNNWSWYSNLSPYSNWISCIMAGTHPLDSLPDTRKGVEEYLWTG